MVIGGNQCWHQTKLIPRESMRAEVNRYIPPFCLAIFPLNMAFYYNTLDICKVSVFNELHLCWGADNHHPHPIQVSAHLHLNRLKSKMQHSGMVCDCTDSCQGVLIVIITCRGHIIVDECYKSQPGLSKSLRLVLVLLRTFVTKWPVI